MALNRPECPNSPWWHSNPALQPSWPSGFPKWPMRKYQTVILVFAGTAGSRQDHGSPISFAVLSAFAAEIRHRPQLPLQQLGERAGPGWEKQPTHILAAGFLFSLPEVFIFRHLGANKISERHGGLSGSSAFWRASDVKTEVRQLLRSTKYLYLQLQPLHSGAQRFLTSCLLWWIQNGRGEMSPQGKPPLMLPGFVCDGCSVRAVLLTPPKRALAEFPLLPLAASAPWQGSVSLCTRSPCVE